MKEDNVTPEQKAIRQHLSKPEPCLGMCGCMGPMALPGQPQCDGKNWDQIKREPLCPCAMSYVEIVDDQYYRINTNRSADGITHSATLLGPIGGPYMNVK
jgi:hypothetical protein